MTVRSVRVDDRALVQVVRKSSSTRQVLQPVATKATRVAQQVARERLTMRTRVYVNSFKSHVAQGRGAGEIARIVVENTAPYAAVIEQGSRPHTMPAKASVYVFAADNGDTVFTHGPINHPGTQPQRVIEVALKRVANGGAF